MNKLLRAGFRRMFQSRLYQVGLYFSVGLALFAIISRYMDVKDNLGRPAALQYEMEFRCVESFAFILAVVLLFVITVVTSLYLGTDYSDGTIRNKIITGHDRFCIYLSNYIVCATANLSMLLACYLTVFGIGKQLLRDSYMSAGEILQNCICQCFTVLGFTAVLVLISMLIQNKATASVLALLLTINLFIFGMGIANLMERMEKIESNWINIADEEERDAVKAAVLALYPNYLSGSKRANLEVFDKLLPFNQLLRISSERAGDTKGIMEGYSALTVIVLSGLGVFLFRKKDLK